ncbi:hypothetical protein CC79DRAFT_777950 [Sarocladium strictum]
MENSGDAGSRPSPQLPAIGKTRPSARGTASYQRRRAVTACQVCRARRTKCDNLKPSCSFCLKTGAKCIQSAVDLSSFDPASLKILERLDHLEELIQNVSLDSDGGGSHHKRRAVVIQPAEQEQEQELTPEPKELDQSVFLPADLHIILSTWPCFQGLVSHDGPFSETSPGQESLTGFSTRWSGSGIAALDLELPRLNKLLDDFFAYVHVKNPIFDERVTRRTVQATVINGLDWSPESCISLLICALGSIATPFGPEHNAVLPETVAYASAMAFFQAAQKRLGSLLCSDETLITAQCLFLSGVFMMCTFQETKAWRYFLQALAHCQQLSFLSPRSQRLYHTSLGDDNESHDFDSLHQAIYWSSWKSERELRTFLTLTDFSTHEHGSSLYPNFFPTPPPPQVGDIDRASSDQWQQKAWYFYLAEISLRRLATRMIDTIQACQKQHTSREGFLAAIASHVPSFEGQISEWIQSLPGFLSFSEPANEDDVCRFVLRGHAINLYETIYWPFLAAHLDSQSLSGDVLEPFSSLAQAALDHHALRLEVNEPGYRHRHHGTVPMLRSCSRSAAVLVATWRHNIQSNSSSHSESSCKLRMPSNWYGGVQRVIGATDYWAAEFPKLDRTRLVLAKSISDI